MSHPAEKDRTPPLDSGKKGPWDWGLFGSQARLDRAERAFQLQQERAADGIHRHAIVACAAFFLLMGPTSVTEIAAACLAAFSLVRLPKTWRTLESAFMRPVPIVLLAWTAWQCTTLIWSPNPRQGLDEIAELRWSLLLFCVWPAIRARKWMIAALAAGFLLGHLTQVLQLIGQGSSWYPWVREPDRISGWWDPAVGGSLLAGALGLHLPAAFMGKGRTRVIAMTMSIITLAAILATGTRGAWLAAIGLLVIIAGVALWTGRRRARIAVMLVAVAITVVFAAFILRGPITTRIHEARDEITRAVQHKEFTTSTGARLLLNWWALEAFAQHPIAGVGAGGFGDWVEQHLREQGIDPAQRHIHAHAHNAILHIAATSGAVGLSLAGMFIVFALKGAFAYLDRSMLGTYLAGPGFGLIGLLLVSAFDSVHLNSQSAALIGALLALAPGWIPRHAREAFS